MVNFKQFFSIVAALSLVQSAVYFHTKFGHSYDAYLTTTLQNQGELIAVAGEELIPTATATNVNNNTTTSSNATVTEETEMIGTILDHANNDGEESSSTTATTTSSTRIRPDSTAATGVATTAERAVAERATIATTTKQPSTTTTMTTNSAAQTQNELRFYRHVSSEMKRLINTTTMMDWNRHRRRRGKFSQFLDFFESYHIHDDKLDLTTVPDLHSYKFFYHGGGLCTPAKVFGRFRESNSTPKKSLPHVLLSRLNPDFGALSSNIMGKTAKLRNLRQDWKKQKCTPQIILDYINHPDTLGVITNQFQMWNHPKVTSIPLGLSAGNHDLLLQVIHRNDTDSNSKRPKLVMINANVKERPGWRSQMIHQVIVNFWRRNVPLQNTYNAYTPATCNTTAAATGPRGARRCYYQEMLQSTFIMSPGGLGLDCFRHWEALYLGCIPVLERNYRADTDGWIERTMADLPIAWIDSYADLTPSWLQAEYERLVLNVTRPFEEIYKYEKLTRQYWIQYAHSIVQEYKEKRKQRQPPPQQEKKKKTREAP